MDYKTRREELNHELRLLNDQEEADRKAVREKVKPHWRFTLVPAEPRIGSWEKIRDDTIKPYRLVGEVTNRAECIAAGWPEDHVRGGAMTYLFNTLSGKIVMNNGGGTLYIYERSWTGEKDAEEMHADSERVYSELEALLQRRISWQEMDVTTIILRQRHIPYDK